MKQKRNDKIAYNRMRKALRKSIGRGSKLSNAQRQKFDFLDWPEFKRFRTRLEIIADRIDEREPRQVIIVPEIFCLIQNPEESLQFLDGVKKIFEIERHRNAFISHEKNRVLGVAASFLFDQIISEASHYWSKRQSKLLISGRASKYRSVNNFLVAFGLLKELGIDLKQLQGHIDIDYQRRFGVYRESGSEIESYKKGNASAGIASYFNDCLKRVNHRLTLDGEGLLVDAIGEMLGNVEEHAGGGAVWHVLGCFEKESGYSSFAIINFGRSIYESLSDDRSTAREVLEKIEKIVLAQRNLIQKTTDYFADHELAEPIWNVMALQEGVSSRRNEDDPTRGRGLMDVIQFFSELNGKHDDAQISIVSGSSSILIDFQYDVQLKTIEADGREEKWRQIAFNEDGDLHGVQDRKRVKYLKDRFPGTIITGRFKLTSNYGTNPHARHGA